MIKVIIVDDEKNSLELIDSKLSNMNQFKVIGGFTNPIKAYEAIISLKPDLVITDIEMPVISGVELAKKVIALEYQIHFVFLTAYKKYAIEAFDINAVHYLLKPISKKDLEKVYFRVKNSSSNRIDKTNKKNKILTLGDFLLINSKRKKVEFPTAKVEELFALLIMSKSYGVGKWKLINELWDISEIKKPLQNLYTTIYRLKKTFEKYELPYEVKKINDHYSIKINNTFFDYEEFNSLLKELKTLEVTEENLVEFKKLINLYSGDLFMYNDYIWCVYDRSALNHSYDLVLKNMQEYYKSKGNKEGLFEMSQLIKRNNYNN